MRDPGNFGELAMITLPKFVQARFVILGKSVVCTFNRYHIAIIIHKRHNV